MLLLFGATRPQRAIIFLRDILVSVILEHGSRDQAENCAGQYVCSNGVARPISSEKPRRDQWSRTTRDYGRQLIAQGSPAVAQPPGEGFSNQRGLRPIHHIVRN